MNDIIGYTCTTCHKVYRELPEGMTCPKCDSGGILDVIFDYTKIKRQFNKKKLKKNTLTSIWRYLPLLPVEQKFTRHTLDVGMTPLYEGNNLASYTKTKKIYIKDDGVNPTGSLKDRASAIAVAKALESGHDTIACASTGNAASSLAGNAAKAGLKTVIFVPKRAPIGKLTQLLAYGATVVRVDGDYKQAFIMSKKAIQTHGWYNRNAAINPYLVEGKKTVALEIAEQLGFRMPDWIVVSVGDGCTLAGVYKALSDLDRLEMIDKVPKLLGVQSEGCQPFVQAFENDRPLKEADENTVADSIAVGIPRNPVKAMDAIKKTNGQFIAVSDQKIMHAMKTLGNKEGIFAEPAASATVAGFFKARNRGIITSEDTVVLINTGNGLKDTPHALEALGEPPLIKPTINALNTYLKEEGAIQ